MSLAKAAILGWLLSAPGAARAGDIHPGNFPGAARANGDWCVGEGRGNVTMPPAGEKEKQEACSAATAEAKQKVRDCLAQAKKECEARESDLIRAVFVAQPEKDWTLSPAGECREHSLTIYDGGDATVHLFLYRVAQAMWNCVVYLKPQWLAIEDPGYELIGL